MEHAPCLTPDIVQRYITEGMIRLVVDTARKLIYPLPRNINNLAFVAALLKIKPELLLANKALTTHLVPSVIKIKDNKEVIGILTGISSMELGYHVTHHKATIDLAHALVKDFITYGEIPEAPHIERQVIYKFADD